ncbi:MAG: CotH kinase family protein [Flavobacteriia bacterium]|nr:CotH kinase family protein [Flavobacteriia bacterium]
MQKIELFFSQPNWDYQLDTSKIGLEGYVMADSMRINGVLFDSIGVKYKGNSSYNSTYDKNPLHIALDEYKSQNYQGYKDVKLGNGYGDPSMIREVLSYSILGNYMDCPKANFAQVYINGIYNGIYSNDEGINKKFCAEHFYSSTNTFVKCNPTVNPSPTTKSNLKYIPSADSTGYYNFYEMKSTSGWSELIDLCNDVTNSNSTLADKLDLDRVIWMLAFNNVLVNLDSYSGVFAQNYYLYKDNTARFNPIIWDLNMSLGGFPYLGSGATSMNSLSVTNMQQLIPSIHAGDPNWPLMNVILNNARYKKMYIAHMKTITEEFFASNEYVNEANILQNIIDTAVQIDTNTFFSYNQFQNGLSLNIVNGSYTVPGISNLMDARVNYLNATAEFNYLAPTISAIQSDVLNPTINSSFIMNATVTNALTNAVFFGYRTSFQQKFIKIQMYDDGLHSDGAANDNVYGVSLTMLSSEMQYYIYAENNEAGKFSLQRAEHTYYTITANVQTATIGQIVLNEFLASNQTDTIDHANQYDDWIELYNTTNTPLSLSGLYLTDDTLDLYKYVFPSTAIIPAYSHLIIWADQENSTTDELHCNFKLSAAGDFLALVGQNTIYDSIRFSIQNIDVSVGRCPDGIGNFVPQDFTTFNASNCVLASVNSLTQTDFQLFPNPTSSNFKIASSSFDYSIKVLNQFGEEINVEYNESTGERIYQINNLNSGIYTVQIQIKNEQIQVKKLVVIRE